MGPVAWFVPGRIEVLGKHTDYAGGRSLICAIERGIRIVARARIDDRVRIVDAQREATFDSSLRAIHGATMDDWFVYPSTVLGRMTRNFPAATRGFDAVFDSDLPSAAGLSSSSVRRATNIACGLGSARAIARASSAEGGPPCW